MRLSIEEPFKRYRGGKLGLDGFSAEISPGILGLLGPNGAGKSTPTRILATITKPTAGWAKLDGVDIQRQPDSDLAAPGPRRRPTRPHAMQIGGIVPAYTGQRPHERVHDRHSSPCGSCVSFRARRRR